MNNLLQSIVSTNMLLANVSNCFKTLLMNSEFQTAVLINTNATSHLANSIYQKIALQSNFAWKTYNTDIDSTPTLSNYDSISYEKSFFIYVLKSVSEYQDVSDFARIRFITADREIILIDNKPDDSDAKIRSSFMDNRLLNLAYIFWKDPLDFYVCSGLNNQFLKLTFDNSICPTDIGDRLFNDKTINLHGLSVPVMASLNPPRIIRTIGRYKTGEVIEYVGGMDLMLADEIGASLKATFTYYIGRNGNGISETAANFNHHFNVTMADKYNMLEDPRGFESRSKILAREPRFDIQVSDSSKYNKSIIQAETVYLYPHDTELYIIIVPKILKSQMNLSNFFNSSLFYSWSILIFVVAIVRVCFIYVTQSSTIQLSDVLMDTFGLSLGKSTEVKIANTAENVLVWYFCLGTMLAGMILSTYLFQGFALNYEDLAIDSLEELKKSKMEIRAPTHIYNVGSFFVESNITSTLQSSEADNALMVSNGDTRYAYVIRESKFNIIIKNKNIWNVVHYFGEEHISFKLIHYSSLVNRFNVIIQRMVEHGIVAYLKRKNKLILKSENKRLKSFFASRVNSVSIADIDCTLWILLAGVTLATLSVLMENLTAIVLRS